MKSFITKEGKLFRLPFPHLFIQQLMRFGIIGFGVLGAHLLLVMYFVKQWGVHPLNANILSFFFSIQLSYWGHYKWTFKADHISHKSASTRFFVIACGTFILNEIMYAMVLQMTNLPYDVALFMISLLVATSRFFLAKFWAFR